jgi:hypothetical protein
VKKPKSPTWYDTTIEEPIRDVVRLLRDNGFNTECSCGHEMYIQCNYTLEGEMQRLHNLLFSHFGTTLGRQADYEIELHVKVQDGHVVGNFFDVRFPKGARKEAGAVA